jgi:hypothetical protein
MNINGIKFKGYKSFTKEYADINSISNINVFIGRNNSGKSSCLDIIENLTNVESLSHNAFLNNGLEIEIGHNLSDSEIRRVFRNDTFGGGISGNHYEFGKNFIGKELRFLVGIKSNDSYDGSKLAKFEYTPITDDLQFHHNYNNYWAGFAKLNVNEFTSYKFRRLDAERNIVAEQESDDESLSAIGVGASNLIRKFLNYSEYDESLIEVELLNALNKIVYPDTEYSAIRVQQVDYSEKLSWEIFLQEGEQRYALSKMGSGLKTVILVLLNLHVIPLTKEYKGKKIIYAFEELENNLHPALQRRLFEYLYDFSVRHDAVIFITTHSHIAINAFCEKEFAQIYHVIKQSGISKLLKIEDFITKSSLLNDLDVKASDLLQANGIIWVEGPSDRVYIKRWLEVFGENKFEEGRDYQFLYYGGRLLSHYSANQEKEQQDLINVLLTNRNAAIVIDSDKKSRNASINETKKRVMSEFDRYNAYYWITKGKEIENYVAYEAIEKAYDKKLKGQCEQYELFPDYIKTVCSRFTNDKVTFAHKVCDYISADNSTDILDLKVKIQNLIVAIKQWNS